LAPEFALIAQHFRPLAGQGGLDLSDDAALLTPPPGRELVLAADAMVGGVHFLAEDPPETIGRKLLRVNLSDLAAMGADPLAYLMTVALPRATPASWLDGFVAGLAQAGHISTIATAREGHHGLRYKPIGANRRGCLGRSHPCLADVSGEIFDVVGDGRKLAGWTKSANRVRVGHDVERIGDAADCGQSAHLLQHRHDHCC
jgi:hypothetical protein